MENKIIAIGGELRPTKNVEIFDSSVKQLFFFLCMFLTRFIQAEKWKTGTYKLKTSRTQAVATVVPKSFYSC